MRRESTHFLRAIGFWCASSNPLNSIRSLPLHGRATFNPRHVSSFSLPTPYALL
jgi:hypothetical protein